MKNAGRMPALPELINVQKARSRRLLDGFSLAMGFAGGGFLLEFVRVSGPEGCLAGKDPASFP